jgi:hypothetical protein
MIRIGSSILDPTYNSAVLTAVEAGDYVVTYADLVSGPVTMRVFADALKMDIEYPGGQANGVRLAVSATLEQQIADLLGCYLMTSKISELRYGARSVTIPPFPLGPVDMATTARMVLGSQKMDAAIQAGAGAAGVVSKDAGIVGTVGKDWILDNRLLDHAGRAINYGWFLPNGTPSPWQGVPLYSAPGRTAMLIQPAGWAHDIVHADYSQTCTMVSKRCLVDGQEKDLRDVLTSPDLSQWVSYQGPLKLLRQPGVPELERVTPPTEVPAPVGPASVALMGVGIGVGAAVGGPPGAMLGGAAAWLADGVRRRVRG